MAEVSATSPLQASESGPTLEEFYHFLFNESKTKFHTEIENPDGMTRVDVLRKTYRRLNLGPAADVLDDYCEWKRVNWTANKRKRAEETVKIAQAQAEVEKNKKSVRELLMGTMR